MQTKGRIRKSASFQNIPSLTNDSNQEQYTGESTKTSKKNKPPKFGFQDKNKENKCSSRNKAALEALEKMTNIFTVKEDHIIVEYYDKNKGLKPLNDMLNCLSNQIGKKNLTSQEKELLAKKAFENIVLYAYYCSSKDSGRQQIYKISNEMPINSVEFEKGLNYLKKINKIDGPISKGSQMALFSQFQKENSQRENSQKETKVPSNSTQNQLNFLKLQKNNLFQEPIQSPTMENQNQKQLQCAKDKKDLEDSGKNKDNSLQMTQYLSVFDSNANSTNDEVMHNQLNSKLLKKIHEKSNCLQPDSIKFSDVLDINGLKPSNINISCTQASDSNNFASSMSTNKLEESIISTNSDGNVLSDRINGKLNTFKTYEIQTKNEKNMRPSSDSVTTLINKHAMNFDQKITVCEYENNLKIKASNFITNLHTSYIPRVAANSSILKGLIEKFAAKSSGIFTATDLLEILKKKDNSNLGHIQHIISKMNGQFQQKKKKESKF